MLCDRLTPAAETRGYDRREGHQMAMMQSAEDIKKIVQEHVAEPVLAIGSVQPAGTWGSFGLGRLSPLAGMIGQAKANKNAGALSNKGAFFRGGKSPNSQTMIAVTADKLYALEAKYGWGGMKIKSELGQWDRKDLKITLEPGKVSTKITVEDKDGGHYEVEATTAASRGFNDDMLNELAKQSA
jgi:hypothetical protein